jgi:hypothetical protein
MQPHPAFKSRLHRELHEKPGRFSTGARFADSGLHAECDSMPFNAPVRRR